MSLFCESCESGSFVSFCNKWRYLIPHTCLTIQGCSQCLINSDTVIEATNQIFSDYYFSRVCDVLPAFEEHTLGELMMGRCINEEFLSLTDEMAILSPKEFRNIKSLPIDLTGPIQFNPVFVRAMEIFIFNLNVWKAPVARRLATDCVPLVVVTRRGQITATVARNIILMVGNCLINKCEVFDRLVYTECEVVDGRIKM